MDENYGHLNLFMDMSSLLVPKIEMAAIFIYFCTYEPVHLHAAPKYLYVFEGVSPTVPKYVTIIFRGNIASGNYYPHFWFLALLKISPLLKEVGGVDTLKIKTAKA